MLKILMHTRAISVSMVTLLTESLQNTKVYLKKSLFELVPMDNRQSEEAKPRWGKVVNSL